MRKKVKLVVSCFLILLTLSTLSACRQVLEPDSKKIGYAINNLNDTFQTYILDAAKKEAKATGYEFRVENAKEDLIAQQDQVNALIQNRVGALVVVPVDTSAMSPIVQAAQDAKIPLIFVNRNPYAGKEDEMPKDVYYVGSEEITAGIMQMDFIGNELGGKGGIAIAMGILGNEGAMKRSEGVTKTVTEKYPDIKVLAKETADWQRDKALGIAENWISTYGDKLNAIIANNDEMALGAVQAAKNTNRKNLLIAGVDAIPDAIEAVEKGDLIATVFQDGVGQGQNAIQIIDGLNKGQKPKDAVTYVPFQLVTKENVQEFK